MNSSWPDPFRTSIAPNHLECVRALNCVLKSGQVTELVAIDVISDNYPRPHLVGGFFNDVDAMARAAVELSPCAKGVFYMPNPIDRALLARSVNRVQPIGSNHRASDSNIVRRDWLLIDIDPKRPSGISSSDDEHDAAIEKAVQIRDLLDGEGWPCPILADSGNGAHLMYPVDLPADDGGLVKRVLEGLAIRFDDDVCQIDTAVFNPGRIWKLPGTLSRKGDDTAERPHRLARILEAPGD